MTIRVSEHFYGSTFFIKKIRVLKQVHIPFGLSKYNTLTLNLNDKQMEQYQLMFHDMDPSDLDLLEDDYNIDIDDLNFGIKTNTYGNNVYAKIAKHIDDEKCQVFKTELRGPKKYFDLNGTFSITVPKGSSKGRVNFTLTAFRECEDIEEEIEDPDIFVEDD